MTLPLKLLATIGTASVAVAYVAMAAQGAPPKDPAGVVCDGVDERDPRVPPAVAEQCAQARAQRPARPPAGGKPGTQSPPRNASAQDPFDDPWVIGPADGSGAGSGNARLSSSALSSLEKRIRDLEGRSYFEVVSQQTEKTIMRVGPGGARFFNEAGVAVAAIGTTDAGGYVTGRSPSGAEASIGASGQSAGVRIFEKGLVRSELGTDNGPFALRFPGGKGLIAGIGEARSGSGAVIVGTVPGVTEGAITVSDSRPMVSLTKDAGPGGLAFAEATIGGGFLHVVMAGGQSAVKMGHNGQRYGIVLTGPILGVPYVPRTGIPGSYFVGCASGEKPACLPEVAQQ